MFDMRYKVLMIAFMLILGGSSAARAQGALGGSIVFDVPMDFVVNGRMMAPGRYAIARSTYAPTATYQQLFLRGENGQSMALGGTIPKYSRSPANDAAMIF